MPTRTPTQSWSHLKPHFQHLDKDALVGLLRDLYALTDDKLFLAARCETVKPDEIAAQFRAQIEEALNSDPRNFRLTLEESYHHPAESAEVSEQH
jgi:hypothetical protein